MEADLPAWRVALRAALLVAWPVYAIAHALVLWEGLGLGQNLLVLGATLLLAAGARAALGPGPRPEARPPGGGREDWPAREMPPGLGPRIALSLLALVAWAVYAILHAAFLWARFSTGQNLALLAATFLLGVALVAAMWVPYGLRAAAMHRRRGGGQAGGAPPSASETWNRY